MRLKNPNAVAARLWKLPGQLLLSLINATAIFIIIAAILSLIAITRLHDLAGDVASTMTSAVLERVDVEPQRALANLERLADEVRMLREAVRDVATRDDARLGGTIAVLGNKLVDLQSSIDRLADAKVLLTDEAIARLGTAMTDGIGRISQCVNGSSGNK